MFIDDARQGIATHLGHVAVGDHRVRLSDCQALKQLCRAVVLGDRMPQPLKLLGKQHPSDRIIVYHHNGQRSPFAGRDSMPDLFLWQGVHNGQPERHRDRRPLTLHAIQREIPFHHVRELATDIEPQPAALRPGTALTLTKRLEQTLLRRSINPLAGVCYCQLQQHKLAVLPLRLRPQHHLTVVGEFNGVAQQVGDDLAKTHHIDQYVPLQGGIHFQQQLQ